MGVILAAVAITLLAVWAVHTQRKLVVMDENVNTAMNQIGVQLSSCFDAVTALLDVTERYAVGETRAKLEAVRSRRRVITAASAPEDVLQQEDVIAEALACVAGVAAQYPELQEDETYVRCMNAIGSYGKMVRTSSLIYNDSVGKLNRELRLFPTSLMSGVLGFHLRGYLTDNKQQTA